MAGDITNRLRKVVNWLIFNELAESEKALAELLGYTRSSFSQIMNGKVPLSDKFLRKLCSLDENINEVWIKTGDGSLFKKDIHVSQKVYGDNNQVAGRDINVSSADVGKLIETVNLQQVSISELIKTNQSQVDRFMGMIEQLTLK